ncbi:MAG: DUF4421 family protein, partial [Bacteroidota bacterium]|nr:DUF4421 family protein [Bacteroidota bacterium]
MKRNLISTILLFLPIVAFPQSNLFQKAIAVLEIISDNDSKNIDTNYIKEFPTKYSIKPIFASQGFSTSFLSGSIRDIPLKYKANTMLSTGVGVTYRNLQLKLLANIPGTQKDELKYGSTKYYDLSLYFRPRKYTLQFFYKNYKGFYINSLPNGTIIDKNEIHEFENSLKFTSYGLKAYYVFSNNKFSKYLFEKQSEKQLKSAGSLFIGCDAHFMSLENDSNIISFKAKNDFSKINEINKIEQYSLDILGGYAYNFIINKRFYFSPMIMLGSGYQKMSFGSGIFQKENSINAMMEINSSVGYNGDNFFM